jgi:hypothetical protein
VAEIARDIEGLGRAMESRDHLARSRFGTAERTKGWPAQAGQSTAPFFVKAGEALMLRGRAIEIAQGAYQRLTVWKNTVTEADARKAGEQKLAECREEAWRAAEEKTRAEAARDVAAAQGRAAAARSRQMSDAGAFPSQRRERHSRLNAEKETRKTAEGNPKSDAKAKELAQRAEAALTQERARSQELEQQLAAHVDDQKLLAKEQARSQELEQQLAARADDQKLLAREQARSRELEQQLARRWDATLRRRTLTATLSNIVMPTAPDAPGSLKAARFLEQGRLLLHQGDIITARSVFQRAAESGSGNSTPRLLPAAFTRQSID